MVMMVGTSVTYTAYTMNQIGEMAEVVESKQVRDYEQTTEKFDIVKIRTDDNQFNMTLKNTGTLPIHLTRLWVENTTDSSWPTAKYDLDINIASGNTVKNIGQDIGLVALDTESYMMDIVTERGNSQKIFLNAVGTESNYINLRATPSSVASGFTITLLLEVVNTGSTQLLNLQPNVPTVLPGGTGSPTAQLVGLGESDPPLVESLKPGNTAIFEYVYTVTGESGDTLTFTTSLINGLDSDSTTVTIKEVESAENANVALQAEGLGPSAPIDNTILVFHQEQINTPGNSYQMYSGSPEGGENGLRVQLDSGPVTFITMNGTESLSLLASNWVASLALQSEEVPTSLIGQNVDMIFHFEDGQDANPDDSVTNDGSRNLQGCAGAGCSGWYPNGIVVNPDWEQRKQIVIQGSRVVGGPHTDFPVLIKITGDAVLAAGALANGDDIVFTNDLGTIKLDHEIESYSNGNLVAWVEVPSITSGTDVAICMYFDNNQGIGNQENISGVWSDNYEAVYHLHDDFLDSTSNDRDGTNNGSVDTSSGIAGDAQDFEAGDEDYIDVGTWSVTGSNISLSAWVYWESFPSDDPRIISKANGGNTNDHVFMLGEDSRQVRERIKTGTSDGSGTTTLLGASPNMSTGTWYLMSATYDGSTMRVFENGDQRGSTSKSGSLRENSWDVWLGNNPVDNRAYDGIMDEVRISSEARSANWFETEYNMMNPADVRPFLVITTGGGGGNPTWVADSGPHGSGSYLFDGENDCFISASNVDPDDNNDIYDETDTTALWFKTALATEDLESNGGDGITSEEILVYWAGDGTCPSCDYYKISLDNTGKVLYEFDNNLGGSTSTCTTVSDYDDNTWYHVTGVRGVDNGDLADSDDCVLYVHDIEGTSLERVHEQYQYSGTDYVNADGRWTVGSIQATDANFFNGYIDDIMHWNGDGGEFLDTAEAEDLAKANYGDAAHKINFDLSVVNQDGTFVSNIVSDLETDVPFMDPGLTGSTENNDALYTYFNHTMAISPVTLSPGQRVNFTMSWVPATTVWEPLDLDMKVDDTGFTSPFPSYIEMSVAPTVAFPSYYVYYNDLELDVFISNIGNDGVYYVSQGTRASFNGTNGAYAGLIHSINGTVTQQDTQWVVDESQDSIYFAPGELTELWFYQATDHPSILGEDLGTLVPAGVYTVKIWTEGYTDQGESFSRTVTLGSVTVIEGSP